MTIKEIQNSTYLFLEEKCVIQASSTILNLTVHPMLLLPIYTRRMISEMRIKVSYVGGSNQWFTMSELRQGNNPR